MNLKNKDIAEGMRVVNGKQVWRVVYWNDKYTDVLLQSIDRNENRTNNYVIAEFYELYGNEKEPQITWMNGNYFDARNEDEAFDFFMNWLVGDEKKSIKEKISRKYKYDFKHFGDFEIVQFDDRNFEIYAVHKDTENVLNFKIEKTYVYEDYNDDICLFVGEVEELGWCFIAFDKYENDNNIYAYQYHEIDKSWAYSCLNTYKLYLENKKVYRTRNIESKKKSLKESAKPIDEKNVSKFVDELNEWCDDNIHYKDEESAHFTKEYGKLYNFKYDLDYSFGDKGDWLVFDNQGTLNWYKDNLVVPFIEKLAKKYGWYAEPCHSYSDFMLGEI